ncbi:aconitate hydratase AcnA [Acidobacteria bacterium AH-259-O06]|nr:aconitate hydratase AcnA [Acidobacteria bacterium AH-259-O06]
MAMSKNSLDSFGVRSSLQVNGRELDYFDLTALEVKGIGNLSRLPFSLKILLENLLRHEDGEAITDDDIKTLINWDPKKRPDREIAFTPARVILQDFTGVPTVVDLAVMRDAMAEMGGDPAKINPLVPSELVIDHSVQVDSFGGPNSFQLNVEREFERNRERYAFLRWGQSAFDNFHVVPPATGIVHQVNLEYLARVVFESEVDGGRRIAYPDTLVGTDSHTTMINGLGVLGWGVGGIEAEAAMLGQPISLLIPQVVGFRVHGRLPEGATATDLVLTITQMLRGKGVVGKFVEFYGPGISSLSLANRATIGNMSPEYGATCAIFPIDAETLEYLRLTARSLERVALVETYAKAQGLFHTAESPEAEYSDALDLDLGRVEPSLAGPKRPQDLIPLRRSKDSFQESLRAMTKDVDWLEPGSEQVGSWEAEGGDAAGVAVATAAPPGVKVQLEAAESGSEAVEFELRHGVVVIAAITSCTNTSNPSVMIGSGLLAKNAVERGLHRRPWVKTSLAPGSKVVTEYLEEAGLLSYLNQLGFNLVGYGCTTCIGNSGPLPQPVSLAVERHDLVVCSVLSGNRNFEGRINPHVRANYLASPPLVVAYALAGRMDIDLYNEPLGQDGSGKDVYLKDIWPSQEEIHATIRRTVKREMFARKYADVFTGDQRWQELPIPPGNRYAWDDSSTYIKQPPFFARMPREPQPLKDIRGMRVLAVLADSVTTDHISPAGSIPKDGPAGLYLISESVEPKDFNSFGSRRGNHEVMMRGTFGNIRLRNLLAPGTEGGYTIHPSSSEPISIYDAAMKYREEGVSLLVIAGKEYGSGSSRDWAAKGTRLLGVEAVLAESFERIHRSNLIGMGVLPLQFEEGQNRKTLALTGFETYHLLGLEDGLHPGKKLAVRAVAEEGTEKSFSVITRVDTPNEVTYYRHGGILHYVLRTLRD